MAKFPFNDLHSFKDYVIYVQSFLPDRFRPREGVGPEDQWTLELAFKGLYLGLDMAVKELGDRIEFVQARRLVAEAYDAYTSGNVRLGFKKLEEVYRVLRRVPSEPPTPMERIFGKGAFEKERRFTGTRAGEADTVRYISFDDPDFIPKIFEFVVTKNVLIPGKGGGIVNAGTKLETPGGGKYFAVIFHGDVEGWRNQVEHSAAALGHTTAKIVADQFVVADGRSYPLSACKVEFY